MGRSRNKVYESTIHHNLVKRGYIDEAENWQYSYARNYVGVYGLLEIDRLW